MKLVFSIALLALTVSIVAVVRDPIISYVVGIITGCIITAMID